jgi:hypothetical protein
MASTPLVTAAMLRATLSLATYMALFDDEQLGITDDVDKSLAVTLVLRRSHTRVNSRLATIYSKRPLPSGSDAEIDDLLLDAELNYACGMAFDRHPEYTRSYGEEPRRKAYYDQAEAVMENIQAALMRLVQTPPEDPPKNVGGIVYAITQRVMSPDADGTLNSGDF